MQMRKLNSKQLFRAEQRTTPGSTQGSGDLITQLRTTPNTDGIKQAGDGPNGDNQEAEHQRKRKRTSMPLAGRRSVSPHFSSSFARCACAFTGDTTNGSGNKATKRGRQLTRGEGSSYCNREIVTVSSEPHTSAADRCAGRRERPLQPVRRNGRPIPCAPRPCGRGPCDRASNPARRGSTQKMRSVRRQEKSE